MVIKFLFLEIKKKRNSLSPLSVSFWHPNANGPLKINNVCGNMIVIT